MHWGGERVYERVFFLSHRQEKGKGNFFFLLVKTSRSASGMVKSERERRGVGNREGDLEGEKIGVSEWSRPPTLFSSLFFSGSLSFLFPRRLLFGPASCCGSGCALSSASCSCYSMALKG